MKVNASVFGMPESGSIRLNEIASFGTTKLYTESSSKGGWTDLHTAIFNGNLIETKKYLLSEVYNNSPTTERVYVIQEEINPKRPSERVTIYNIFETGTTLFNINPENQLIKDLLLQYNIEPISTESTEMTTYIT